MAARDLEVFVFRVGRQLIEEVGAGALDQRRLIPLEFGQRFARDIAGSRVVVFDELGHVPHEEDPARTVAVVKTFLGR
ncbi:alpha/beta fold hydrolase [Polaromonas sp. AER18D-145]|uniref:alpha/beta fold hydrolase n=1 Tax=Polaromonas sp. AER18D-145 TaxID=1977060 RepID=UPI00197C1754|nr:hypothetical protein [Polaromonas sp. AER18D-145]